MIDKVKKFIRECLENKGEVEKIVLEHLLTTEKYVCKLYEQITGDEVSEELRIAALTHDIERAFREQEVYEKMYKSKSGFIDKKFLEYHSKRSAKIICDFLKKNNYPEDKVEKVYKLVANHEFGGDFETNILKDADSICFFINHAEHFIEVKIKESSHENIQKKLKWMKDRITFNEAKIIVEKIIEKKFKEWF